jgi:LysM repeat protein
MSYRLALIIVYLSLFALNATFSDAQEQNLLQDPSFEVPELKVVAQALGDDAVFAVSPAWDGWYTTTPRDEEWQNRVPNGTSRLNDTPGYVRSGERSMEIGRGYATFTAAIYQTVEVPTGASIRASAWYVMDIGEGANAQARIGIHPSGGRSITDNAIIWSDWSGNQTIADGWKELTLETTAQNNRVTIILYATQSVPTPQNMIYWDDASLVITGAPAPTPLPPEEMTVAVAPDTPEETVTVQLVAPNPDGSIVHTTRDGETAVAIASAYNIPLNRLLTLNPHLGDGSLIRSGMILTIQPKPDNQAPRPTNLPPATFTPSPTSEADVIEATPDAPTTRLCVLVYDDKNANGQFEAGEMGVMGAQVRLESEGQALETLDMAGKLRSTCLDDLLEGDIRVIIDLPDTYQMVNSSPQRMVTLQAGMPVDMVLGATVITQQPTAIPTQSAILETETPASPSPLQPVQTIGLALFLGAGSLLIVIGGIAFWMSKR